MQFTNLLATAILGFSSIAIAHPGEHYEARSDDAALQLRNFKNDARRGLESCQDKLKRNGFHNRAAARREATFAKHQKKRDTAEKRSPRKKRDTNATLAIDHHSNASITLSSTESDIFENSGTCVLNPEGEVGPFYVLGEYIRADLRETQPGVSVVLDAQFVDVETCEPIPELWWDIWNCNSTGVYAGVQDQSNGNGNDASNLNATFLRGIQETDSDGVVQFQTIFPGHYAGRTNHHHLIAHLNATVLSNGTLTGGSIAHVGQLFWDQDIIYEVEATYPYNTNNITLELNVEDRVVIDETEDSTSDPFFEYAYLGDDVSDGLFGWVTVAVNLSATYDPTYSFAYTASGGIAESGGSSS